MDATTNWVEVAAFSAALVGPVSYYYVLRALSRRAERRRWRPSQLLTGRQQLRAAARAEAARQLSRVSLDRIVRRRTAQLLANRVTKPRGVK